jgi:hypothetical protein
LDDVILRVLMVAIGAVMVCGGTALALQAIESQRVGLYGIAVGGGAILIGMSLCVWGLKGFP